MSSTNKTPNANLSQFLGTDHFSFLTDYNGDMLKIDNIIGGTRTLVNNINSTVLQLETDQESNNQNFEKTATAIQTLNTKTSSLETSQSEMLVKDNEQDTKIASLEKSVSALSTKDDTIILAISNVKNGTATKYNPVLRYNPKLSIISVADFSISAYDAEKFSISGSIDISKMSESDMNDIVTRGIRFDCGFLAYSVDQTIDGNRVVAQSLIPLTCYVGANGTYRDAFFSILPMIKPPSSIITDDGLSILAYDNTYCYGHGHIVY